MRLYIQLDDAHARRAASIPGAHQACQTVAIHHADGRQAQHGGRGQVFLRGGCTTQEAEMARRLQLDIALIGNPAAQSSKIKIAVGEKTKGFHTWTEAEIQQYRDFYPLGTRERLAMELYLWTDQRRCDVYKMGKAQIVGGRIPVVQAKTGKSLWVALAPQLLEAIIAMPPHLTSPFCFIVSRKGTAYTKESFGNWFKDACVAAGLHHHNGHGLRKATLRRLAELGTANKPMKALSGQDRDETLAIYTADADQKRLADQAITALARWEMIAKDSDAGDDYRFTAND